MVKAFPVFGLISLLNNKFFSISYSSQTVNLLRVFFPDFHGLLPTIPSPLTLSLRSVALPDFFPQRFSPPEKRPFVDFSPDRAQSLASLPPLFLTLRDTELIFSPFWFFIGRVQKGFFFLPSSEERPLAFLLLPHIDHVRRCLPPSFF